MVGLYEKAGGRGWRCKALKEAGITRRIVKIRIWEKIEIEGREAY